MVREPGRYLVHWRGVPLVVHWNEAWSDTHPRTYPTAEASWDAGAFKAEAWGAAGDFMRALARGGAGRERALRLIAEAPPSPAWP